MKVYTQKLCLGNVWENYSQCDNAEQAIRDAQEADKHWQSVSRGFMRVVKISRPGGGDKPEKVVVIYPAP